VLFADARVSPENVLGAVGEGALLLERIIDRAKVALCADACGGAQRVLELSIAYARSREQFGRPIGSQQAIQHRCADMLVRVEGARSATWRAAWCFDEDDSLSHSAACMAKAYASDAYLRVAGDGIQIHGGLGFTWEQDLHLFFKRAALSSVLFGDSAENRELVARALLD
jgi:alkylation response protein AidB-like acyl-CoA dehydrogenase